MNQIFDRLFNTFSYELITKWISKVLPDLILAILILFIFFIFGRLLMYILNIIFNKIKLDKTIQNLSSNITKSFIFVIGLITALARVGVNIDAILASLGVAGLTIGFAAQDALSNVISGIFIFWDKPFVIGDLIEINGHYGQVDEITMRSTKLITSNGKMLSIPNSDIINSIVASYTNFPNLRIDIDFNVDSNESLKNIRNILFQLVENSDLYLLNPKPELILNQLNDYNIELIFRVWIKDEKKHLSITNALREEIFDALTHNQVEMPYETLNVNINK